MGISPTISLSRQRKFKLFEKTEAMIKRMRGKLFILSRMVHATRVRTPSPIKFLEQLQKDLFKIVEKINFQEINCEFQDKLNWNIKDIKRKRKTLTSADTTSSFYKITKEMYQQLLHNSITKTCKKANSNTNKTIN